MSKKTVEDYRKALNIKIASLRLFGFWLPDENSSNRQKLLYQFNYIFSIVVCIAYIISAIRDLGKNLNNLAIIVEDALFLSALFMVLFKLYVFKSKNKRIIKLTESIYKPIDYLYHNSKDNEIIVLIKNTTFYESVNDRASVILAFLFDLTLFAVILINPHELPTRGDFPFDISYPPLFALAYFIQFGAAGFSISAVIIMDSMIFSYVRWIIVQFHILISNLKETYSFQHILPDLIPQSELESESFDQVHKEAIDQFIVYKLKFRFRKYCHLVSIVKELNSVFSSALIMQVLSGCYMICLGLFQVAVKLSELAKLKCKIIDKWTLIIFSQGERSTQTTIFFFLGACLVQMFSFSWFGSELRAMSDDVTNGLWFSGWEKSLCQEIRTVMTMSLILAKNPLELKAGRFFVVTLETFIVILKSAYSFFVLLSSVNEE